MNMSDLMKKLGALLLVLAMVLILSATAFAEAEPAAEEEDLSALDRIGEETETSRGVKFTNATGTDIMGLNIRRSGDWEFSDELMAEDDLFEKEETSLFCYEPETAGEEDAEAEADAEEAEPVLYDIQIVWKDWTVGILHNVDLGDMEEAVINRAWNSLPYLTYTSLATGEDVDTNDMEQVVGTAEWEAYLASQSSSGSSGGSGGSSYGGDSGCIDNGLFW